MKAVLPSLLGSGRFEARYAEAIKPTRLSRLTEAERREYTTVSTDLENPVKLERAMHLFQKNGPGLQS